jgi:hypothetical protein
VPASSAPFHNVSYWETLPWLAVTEMNRVAIHDFDSDELLRANLRQVSAHPCDGGLNVWDGQRTRIARNRRAIDCERWRSGTGSQQNCTATDA